MFSKIESGKCKWVQSKLEIEDLVGLFFKGTAEAKVSAGWGFRNLMEKQLIKIAK